MYVYQMYDWQNEYVPNKKQTKRCLNDHRMHMRFSSGKLCYLSCIWPFTTQVEQTSTDTYRIPTGCWLHDNRTNCTRTGQTAYQRLSIIHLPYIFIRWRLFDQNLPGLDKRISPDTERNLRMRNGHESHANRHEQTDNFTVLYASVSAIR